MVCPSCGGKVGVIDSVHNTDENEIYRKRKCKDCELIFYTTEFVICRDEKFIREWYRYHRSNV